MPNKKARAKLIELYLEKDFIFKRLEFNGLSNQVLFEEYPKLAREEIVLFSSDVSSGDNYFLRFDSQLENAMDYRKSFPVVRFADGEYWFYSYSLKCNGLYNQAESVAAIKKSIPMHIEALKYVSNKGNLCPLIFKENLYPKVSDIKGLLPWYDKGGSATDFLYLLAENNMPLTKSSYMPFYVVYAYLTSNSFFKRIDGRNICIVNAPINEKNIENWFAKHGSKPNLTYVSVPEEYIATQWEKWKDEIISDVPTDVDMCLVGAGIGALMVCADISRERNCAAVDAGHVLNLMNSRTFNPRLYVQWETDGK